MKLKLSLILGAFCLFIYGSFATELKLNYLNDVAFVKDSTTTLLPKETAQSKTKSSAKNYIPYANLVSSSYSHVYYCNGTTSTMKIDSASSYTFLVKAGTNELNPDELFQFGKFEIKKNRREFKSDQTDMKIGSISNENVANYIPFTSQPYGTEYYLITISNLDRGQYFFSHAGISNFYTFEVK